MDHPASSGQSPYECTIGQATSAASSGIEQLALPSSTTTISDGMDFVLCVRGLTHARGCSCVRDMHRQQMPMAGACPRADDVAARAFTCAGRAEDCDQKCPTSKLRLQNDASTEAVKFGDSAQNPGRTLGHGHGEYHRNPAEWSHAVEGYKSMKG
jgi:hypothetical protein